MTSRKANLHAIVAVATVVGAEFAKLADDTPAQLAAHNWAYYIVLIAAIVVGVSNSFASTDAVTPQNAVTVSPQPAPPAPQPPLSSVTQPVSPVVPSP